MKLERWRSLKIRLDVAKHREVYDALRAAYAEAQRFYHATVRFRARYEAAARSNLRAAIRALG